MTEETSIVRTRRIGGSLVVTIPSEIIKLKQIDENELIEISVNKKKVSGFGILRGMGSFAKEDRARGQFEK